MYIKHKKLVQQQSEIVSKLLLLILSSTDNPYLFLQLLEPCQR